MSYLDELKKKRDEEIRQRFLQNTSRTQQTSGSAGNKSYLTELAEKRNRELEQSRVPAQQPAREQRQQSELKPVELPKQPDERKIDNNRIQQELPQDQGDQQDDQKKDESFLDKATRIRDKAMNAGSSFVVNAGALAVEQIANGIDFAVSFAGRNAPDIISKASEYVFHVPKTEPQKQWEDKMIDEWESHFDQIKDSGATTFLVAGKELPFLPNLTQKVVDELGEVRQAVQPKWMDDWEQAPLDEKLKERWGQTMWVLGTNAIGSLAAVAATQGAAGGSMMAGTSVLGLSTGNDVKKAAIEYGVDSKTADYLGLAVAIPVTILEKFGYEQLLGEGVVKNFGVSFLSKILGKTGGAIASDVVTSGSVEALTEVTQEWIQMAAESTFRELGVDEAKTRTVMSGLGGLFSGLFIGAPASVMNAGSTDINTKTKTPSVQYDGIDVKIQPVLQQYAKNVKIVKDTGGKLVNINGTGLDAMGKLEGDTIYISPDATADPDVAQQSAEYYINHELAHKYYNENIAGTEKESRLNQLYNDFVASQSEDVKPYIARQVRNAEEAFVRTLTGNKHLSDELTSFVHDVADQPSFVIDDVETFNPNIAPLNLKDDEVVMKFPDSAKSRDELTKEEFKYPLAKDEKTRAEADRRIVKLQEENTNYESVAAKTVLETKIDTDRNKHAVVKVVKYSDGKYSPIVSASTQTAGINVLAGKQLYNTEQEATDAGIKALKDFTTTQSQKRITVEEQSQLDAINRKIDSAVSPKNQAQLYVGKAYRAETGFIPGGNAQDVIDYEADALGNENVRREATVAAKAAGVDLAKIPAYRVMWVTRTAKVAQEYGDNVREVSLPEGTIVLSDIGDDGVLVLQPEKNAKNTEQKKKDEKAKSEEEKIIDSMKKAKADGKSFNEWWKQNNTKYNKTKSELKDIWDTIDEQEELAKTLRGTKGMTADDIMKTFPNIKLKRDVTAKDIHGNKIEIDKGEKLTPYELKGNKILLQDGVTYIVSKNQFQNIKGNSVVAEGKPFAPELAGVEESIKGGRALEDQIDSLLDDELGKDMTREEARDFILQDAESDVATKYSQYTLPGGKNYKEILIKAPIQNIETDYAKFQLKMLNKYGKQWNEKMTADERSKALELFSAKGGNELREKTYKSSHWDEPNVLSHIRINERTYKGKPVTFLEELQSDWAKDLRGGQTKIKNPLLKNWQEWSIKRALKEAVDNGSKYFAWINGEQTSTRYDLATQIKEVEWSQPTTTTIGIEKEADKIILIKPNTGSDIDVFVKKDGTIFNTTAKVEWNGKKLDEVLGKGLADKIMSKDNGTLSGEGLSFGGEWAHNLYDEQVPNIVKKLTGAKIVKMDMGLPINNKQKAPFEVVPQKIVDAIAVAEGRKPTQDGLLQNSLEELRERAKAGLDGGEREFDEIVANATTKKPTTTTQQGITLSPDVIAKIKGEAPKIKTSGKKFENKDFFIKRNPKTESFTEKLKPAKNPAELQERIEQLNKFAQSNAILRRTGGITSSKAVGQFVVGDNIVDEGEVRLRAKFISNDADYVTVLSHELGHALEYNTLGSTGKNTLDVFGENLSAKDKKTLLKELKDVTVELEGKNVVKKNPKYYNKQSELFARFLEKMIVSPGNLNDIAPTAVRLFEEQSIAHPMIREFIETAELAIDKGFKKTKFLPDLRQMYQNRLGKRVGNIVYDEEIAHRAMQERAKSVLEKFISQKFKGIKDDPATLFRAAEAIKITRNGKPEFGTRDFVVAKSKKEEAELKQTGFKKVDTQVEDGIAYPVYARQRYTQKEGRAIYNQLSPEGKQLIKDFTSERKEAKDYFNREIIKDVHNIEGNIEGWVHHYFDEAPSSTTGKKLRFREKQAGTRQKRTGKEGYVEDFKKSMTKVLVDLESEKVFNDFITRQFSRVTKPIPDGAHPDAGWVEVVGNIKKGVGLKQEKKIVVVKDGKSFVPKQTRYQMPKEIYERYKLWKGLTEEATKAVQIVSDINRYWRINVLAHPGTAGTNLISGGIQYSTKVLTDFYTETLTGQIKYKKTRQNVSAMLKTLLPKGWNDAPDWIYGADLSNYYGQFTKQPTTSKAISAYGDKALKLFGAYERYWKKTIALSEGARDLKSLNEMTKEGLRLPTKEERALIAQINEQVDLYGYDYDNVPVWLEAHQRSAVGQSIKPFAKYPYKYAKHVTNMAAGVFDQTLPVQVRIAKLLTLATIMGAYATYADKRRKEQQTPEGTEKTPARLSTRGRLFIGTDKDGKEIFARTAKYPFINLTNAGMLLVDGEWEASKDVMSDMIGSIAPIASISLLAMDYRDKYAQYDSVPVILGNTLATYTPGYRILNDVSRMLDPFQRKQDTFAQAFTRLIPTTNTDLQRKLHGDIRKVKIPVEGDIIRTKDTPKTHTTIETTLKNYWQDIALSMLTGIYMTRIDPKEAEAFIIREQKNINKQANLSDKQRAKLSQDEFEKKSREVYESLSGEREISDDNILKGKNILEKLQIYAHAWTIDKGSTLKTLFSDEELRKFRNDTIIFERQKELYKIDLGDPNTDVDHIIPLSLGGDNDFDNLKPMDQKIKAKKDYVVEAYLLGLLERGEITKKEAQRRVKNWEDEYEQITGERPY